jgi:hypothetical protein
MTDLNLSRAVLQAPTHREPHVDSEEAVQYERRRVSQELESISRHEYPGLNAADSLRSRNAPSVVTSQEHLQRHTSTASHLSTQPDLPSASSGTTVPHWFDPVVKFWTTHISIIIDERAHRDHLGSSSRTGLFCI